jgi:myo-inositol-1(or 4)-monophosphatase
VSVVAEETLLELGRHVRERVLPSFGTVAGRGEAGSGAGGDVTFGIDEVAERAVAEFVESRLPQVAFYSEDRGLVAPPDAAEVLVVDPIDGTRPAMAGLESACVAVAVAALGDGEPTMAALRAACVVEIKSGDWFSALAGSGVRSTRRIALSRNSDVARMFWSYGFRGRPVRPTVELLGDLIDASSVGGGTFEIGSQAFAMTRVVSGQFDAVVEVGSRLIDEVPGMQAEFERIGRGQVLNNSPYDLAAPWLCVREAGGVVSDGWGRPLDDRRLLGSGHEFQMSSITAANAELHAQLLRAIDAGVERVRRLWA